MKRILTAGTFDILHPSHLDLLEKKYDFNAELYVMLSTDEFNTLKGKKSIMTYEERKRILKGLSCVDYVLPETSWDDKLKYIKEFDIDIFIMGDDWYGKFDFLKKHGVKVIYYPRGPISSTDIKKSVS